MRLTVSVEELQRAWAAVTAGDFRANHAPPSRSVGDWAPSEHTITVVGATGRVGASIVAVAMGEAAHAAARIIDCAPSSGSGLAAATSAELGCSETGWRRGMRGDLLIERPVHETHRVDMVPAPDGSVCDLTIIDASWPLTCLVSAGGWVSAAVHATPLVVVSIATVPGLRALDEALRLTGRSDDAVCVITGPPIKKWPKPLRYAVTPRIEATIAAGRMHAVPLHADLAITGLTSAPLPRQLLSASARILDQLFPSTKGPDHVPN